MNASDVAVSFLVGTLGAGIASAVIKKQFDKTLRVWDSQRVWKELSVSELLGPVYLQLARTGRAFARWKKQNLYLEGSVIRAGNLAVRDLLLAKPHLIPPTLRQHASALVVHYDVWLEEFDRWRGDHAGTEVHSHAFVFVGPDGFPFPHDAEEAFNTTFEQYWRDLYESK